MSTCRGFTSPRRSWYETAPEHIRITALHNAWLRNAASGYALGYEDLNDHDQLRSDPALAVMIGKEEVDHLMVDVFVKAQTRQPKQIILDLDVTNDLIHGKQEDGSFMATTAITVICRSTSSLENFCYARA